MGRRQKQIRPTKVYQLQAASDGEVGLGAEASTSSSSSSGRKTTYQKGKPAPPVEDKRSNFSISAQLGEGKKVPNKVDPPIKGDSSPLIANWPWQQFGNSLQMFSSPFYPFVPSGFDYSAALYPSSGLLNTDAFSLANYEALFKGMDSETQAAYFSSMLPYLQAAGCTAPVANCNGNGNNAKVPVEGGAESKKRARSPALATKSPPAKKPTRHSTAANSSERRPNGRVVAQKAAALDCASNGGGALDLSVKGVRNGTSTGTSTGNTSARERKSAAERPQADGTNPGNEGNALNQLSSLVSSMSNKLSESPFKGLYSDFHPSGAANFIELYQQFLQSNGYGHSGKGVEVDQSKIFTCLQCFQSFDSLQQLVKHMEKTQHFNSPRVNHADNRTPSTSSATSSKKVPPVDKDTSPSSSSRQARSGHSAAENSKTATTIQCSSNGRSSGPSGVATTPHSATYRFKCLLCDHSSDSSIDVHMTREHSFTSPNEWISAVKLIPL